MTEILPMLRKTLFIHSINQSNYSFFKCFNYIRHSIGIFVFCIVKIVVLRLVRGYFANTVTSPVALSLRNLGRTRSLDYSRLPPAAQYSHNTGALSGPLPANLQNKTSIECKIINNLCSSWMIFVTQIIPFKSCMHACFFLIFGKSEG